MFQNVVMPKLTPLCDTNEIQQWENRPFTSKWPESNQCKSIKDSSVTKKIMKRRNRTAFTTQQLTVLEKTFAHIKYIDRRRRLELAESLRIEEKCIKVWFQNRRMKQKKDISGSSSDSSSDCPIETVTPPPNNVTSSNGQYGVPINNYYEETTLRDANKRKYILYPRERTVDSLRTAYYQQYNSVPYPNYNAQLHASESFRNDAVIYPTQYYPSAAPQYTDLDNQSDQRYNVYNWSATNSICDLDNF